MLQLRHLSLCFEKHIDQITDGKHVLSCIIKNIPGVRNAYKKTLVQVEEGKDEKTLNHYMHSAGIHTLNPDKNAAQSIPRQNYQQLQNASRFGLAYWCLFS